MAFNMGINGLLGFKHTLELVRDRQLRRRRRLHVQ
jgi:hypothetical protein